MTLDDEIKNYLPKYLSAENYDTLIKELEDFPKNIDSRMYTSIADENLLCQGDVIKELPVIEIEHLELGVKNKDCIVLSNTCDIDPNNKRLFPNTRLMYAPLINLEKYKAVLMARGAASEQQINDHIKSIKALRISQIHYLPKTESFNESYKKIVINHHFILSCIMSLYSVVIPILLSLYRKNEP